MEWHGYATNNDVVTFSAWAHAGESFEAIGTFTGTAATTNAVVNLSLFARHMGTSAAELGKVYIRLDSASVGTVINTDQLIVNYSVTSRSVGYANGAVWIDTTSGVAGTENFVNGTADNPVLSYADALTIADSLNILKFEVANGSTITLPATAGAGTNKVFEGHEWTLELEGRVITSSMFIDATVSGTATGAEAEFQDCIIGTTSVVASQYYNCSFTGTQTWTAAGDYRFINCQSGVAGSSAPTFALGTGNISAEFRRWSGGVNFTGIGAGDVITISGEMGTIDLGSATAGTVEVRGTYKALANHTSGVTVNVDGAILGADVAQLQLGIIYGAAAGVPTSTVIPSDLTGYADDQLIGRVIIFASGACEGEATDITDYALTSGVLTVTALTTAPAAADTFKIV